MSRRGSKTKAKEPPYSTAKNPLGNVLVEEHDRGCVLVGCAYLDYWLEKLLRAKFELIPNANLALVNKMLDPEDSRAFLFGGWSKCQIARLTGDLDEETYRILEEIRLLRNRFAHTPDAVDLSDAKVDPIADLITDETDRQYLDMAVKGYYVNGELYKAFGFGRGAREEFTPARSKFMATCVVVFLRIVAKINELRKESPQEIAIAYSTSPSSDQA